MFCNFYIKHKLRRTFYAKCKRDEEFGYSPDLYNEPTIKHFQDDNFYDGIEDDGGIKHFQD